MIADVLRHYFPHWEPPEDRQDWNRCLCPSHAEDRPSCSVSYERDAINCKACGFKGNAVSIIRRQEGVSYSSAVRRAEEITQTGNGDLPGRSARKSSRRVFGQQGPTQAGSQAVPAWLRD